MSIRRILWNLYILLPNLFIEYRIPSIFNWFPTNNFCVKANFYFEDLLILLLNEYIKRKYFQFIKENINKKVTYSISFAIK